MNSPLNALPEGLPIPADDGLAAHLVGMSLPIMLFESTGGYSVDLSEIKRRVVIYIYPLTGHPDSPLPEGWDEIPGARGCTPQACDFRNHYLELQYLNTAVFGLSSQSVEYQLELKHRLHLPFDLLSDSDFFLHSSLALPIFKVNELQFYKRLTLIAEQGVIKKVFYPVFPSNKNAEAVIDWLKNQ